VTIMQIQIHTKTRPGFPRVKTGSYPGDIPEGLSATGVSCIGLNIRQVQGTWISEGYGKGTNDVMKVLSGSRTGKTGSEQ